MPRPAQSHIASLRQAPPPRLVTHEVIFILAFITVLYELLHKRDRQAVARVACPVEPFRMKEASSTPQFVPLYVPPPQPFLILASVATHGTGMTMAIPPGIMTREEIEELVVKTIKE